MVRQPGRLDDWDDIVGREWPSIEGFGGRGSSGLLHRALRAFAWDIGGGTAKGFM